MLKRKVSLAGKRTPVARVAGENSTTEPPMLVTSSIFPAQSHIKYCIHVKNKDCIGGESNPGLPRGRREFYYWTTNACNVNNLPCTITSKILHSPVSRVAGENSTTEPPMLVTSKICPAQSYLKYCIHVKNKDCIGGESTPGLPRGSREFYHWTTNACIVANLPCTIT